MGLPASIALTEADQGHVRVMVTPERPGIVVVEVEGLPRTSRSNPMVVREGAPLILWADLQIHSGVSDGTGTPDEVWHYAREVAALDVAAITDHDHWGMRFVDEEPVLRAALDAAVDRAHEPGRFVALHGYEYTHWLYGHRHVLYFDGPGPVYSSLDPRTDTPDKLWAALEGRQAITVPHHVAGGPVAVDWRWVAPDGREPVVEIVSVHGQSEAPTAPPDGIYDGVPGTYALDQLVAGRRFGFVGSSDGHDGHPGLSHLTGGSGGLTALYADERTREAVWEALHTGRTYATNGPRIFLRTERTEAGLSVRVVGTDRLAGVDVMQREGVVHREAGAGAVFHRVFPVRSNPGDFAYVRVWQEDGGRAWSSPVFF